MPIKIHFLIILLFLFLILRPPFTAAQTGETFKANTGDFTPSTVIIIIIGLVFIGTGFLAVFLRQFSDGCFGLNVLPVNPAVTADGLPVERGLDAEVIKSLPTYLYSDVKQHRLGKVELECAVCLTEFHDSEALRLLPGCSHVFHPRCIDLWLASHVTCPICRQSLESESGVEKPCAIINIPQIQNEPIGDDQDHKDDDHQSANDDQSADHPDHDHDHDEEKEMKKIVGKFPRSHSTGHSLADSERFTLRLPEDVQNSLVNRSSYTGETLVSPRCGWFSMTPSTVPASLTISGSKNTRLPPVKTSERLWPI